MSDTPGRRARPGSPSSRGIATAQRIARSAVALVLQHGYDGTTVDMICAEAGISQRTFFNHFPTKDAAIIGIDNPRLDESRVRAFIAADGPDILADAAALISIAAMDGMADAPFLRERMRAITSSVPLMQRQLERFAAIEVEIAQILEYRLARLAGPDETPDEIREQSRLTAQLLAGVMRYTAGEVMQGGDVPIPAVLEQTRQRLTALLPKLAGS